MGYWVTYVRPGKKSSPGCRGLVFFSGDGQVASVMFAWHTGEAREDVHR